MSHIKGINVFTLKIIAVVLMVLDHLNKFFPDIIPLWFRWFGRLAAPLFIFCVAQGLLHTHNRKKYLIRMYLFSLGMVAGNIFVNAFYPTAAVPMFNNIFATLLLISLIACTIELIKKDGWKGLRAAILIAVSQLIALGLSLHIPHIGSTSEQVYTALLDAILPNVFTCDGGAGLVFIGVCICLFSRNRKMLIASFIFCCSFLIIGSLFSGEHLLYEAYQWMMIASLPFMLLYNGEKGHSMKYFFYLFYPLHQWGLFILANLLVNSHL